MTETTSESQDDPRTPSSDYSATAGYWAMVNAILAGAEAMRAVQSGHVAGPHIPYSNLSQLARGNYGPQSLYLPRYPNESAADYELRRRNAPLTNIYGDISRNLASKPFSKTCELEDSAGDDLKKLAENIDGQGNNMHVFARSTFKAGLDKGIDWILVDYTKVPLGTTLADERAMGARPYWVHIPAERLLAVYSKFINGAEIITHARIDEPCTEQAGYGEISVERVRVLDRAPLVDADGKIVDYAPATWNVFEKTGGKDASGKDTVEWIVVDAGEITIGIIPLVSYRTGKRTGTSWRIEPPLRDLAYMQIEEFQQESNLKSIKELTAFPMLAANGVNPDRDEGGNITTVVPVGPRAVLFAPPDGNGQHGDWTFIEPTAASLTFLQADLEKLRTEMRDLGMQPLTASNLTVITTANVSQKAHSAVQAWALGLKDALEQAWKITCLWLGQKVEPTVNVHTDFGVDFEAGTELASLIQAESSSILSKKTVREEMKRRGVLSDDFDEDEEEQRLAEEQQGLQPEVAIDPVTGAIVAPSTRPKIISGPPTLPVAGAGPPRKPPGAPLQ